MYLSLGVLKHVGWVQTKCSISYLININENKNIQWQNQKKIRRKENISESECVIYREK